MLYFRILSLIFTFWFRVQGNQFYQRVFLASSASTSRQRSGTNGFDIKLSSIFGFAQQAKHPSPWRTGKVNLPDAKPFFHYP
ncbi:hypothetical protein B4N84_07815 [Flavobacterium sp. IR1]|nr:hypothetical protein B4N84_07815 [Flavobacterium sp. IR1]